MGVIFICFILFGWLRSLGVIVSQSRQLLGSIHRIRLFFM